MHFKASYLLSGWLTMLVLFTHPVFSQQFVNENVPINTSAYFRGMSVIDDQVAWVGGSKGTIGLTRDGGKNWKFHSVKGHETLEFRSVYAFDSLTALIANAGTPAYILKTSNGGKSWKQVYINSDPEAFIDGVDFWNNREGIVYGDGIRKKMLLVKTNDGGATWSDVHETFRPLLEEGEGSFAASGTNIRCFPSGKTFIATGGKTSRLFVSDNFGISWRIFTPPITQGKTMTGIFSIGFRDEQYGIVVGGDYEIDTLKKDHVYITKDGGATWIAPTSPTGGIRECVEFITKDLAISLGYPGIDISHDGGQTWTSFSNEKRFSVVRKARDGNLIVLAGQGKIALLKWR